MIRMVLSLILMSVMLSLGADYIRAGRWFLAGLALVEAMGCVVYMTLTFIGG